MRSDMTVGIASVPRQKIQQQTIEDHWLLPIRAMAGFGDRRGLGVRHVSCLHAQHRGRDIVRLGILDVAIFVPLPTIRRIRVVPPTISTI